MKNKLNSILDRFKYGGITHEEATEMIIQTCCKTECEIYYGLEINIPFEDFWNAYDKKTELEKCKKKWIKLKPIEREQVMEHLKQYIPSTPDKKYRKNPATYLNNACWNDEIINFNNTTNGTAKPTYSDKLKEFNSL